MNDFETFVYSHVYCSREEVQRVLDAHSDRGFRVHTFTQSGSMCDVLFERCYR